MFRYHSRPYKCMYCLPLKLVILMVVDSSVRVSNELGRGSSKAAKFSILMTTLTSFSIGLVLFLIFLFLRGSLAYIFTENDEIAKAIADLSLLLAVSLIMNSVQPVLSGIKFYLNLITCFTINIYG